MILLSAEPSGPAEQIKTPLLLIVARDDSNGEGPWLPRIRAWFDKSRSQKSCLCSTVWLTRSSDFGQAKQTV
ncbi:MAG: hypothetical protein DMG70_26035 [Acidobacteria bacterium]|nr:MAG: hypothetical protein DMG70_26035 [Acidobacteriota bacterium]